ncbi:MAG: retropepsin-like aspartic protease [Cyanobacteria bacterium P01_D01_bin.36]
MSTAADRQSVSSTELTAGEENTASTAAASVEDKNQNLTPAEPQSTTQVFAASNAYQEGINLASSAHALTRSALSPDDWGLIASRWQRAADQLKKVRPQDLNYEQAQQKAEEYRLNAEAANARVTQLLEPVYVPITTPATESRELARARTSTNNTQAPLSSANSTQVPIVRRLHGTPIVRVTFNNSRTYEMILDTGASRTLITRQMAQDLGVVTTERMVAATASQAEVSFDIGQVDTISMGDIVLENARVSIGDAVNVGLLGNDFLRGYDVTIRAQAGVVELSSTAR